MARRSIRQAIASDLEKLDARDARRRNPPEQAANAGPIVYRHQGADGRLHEGRLATCGTCRLGR